MLKIFLFILTRLIITMLSNTISLETSSLFFDFDRNIIIVYKSIKI